MTFRTRRRGASAPNPRPLLHCALACLSLLMSAVALATPPSGLAHGDLQLDNPLSDKDCVACHARRLDGGADRLYVKVQRRAHNRAQLFEQPGYCSAEPGSGYFPEEEEHIAAFLNKQYFRFE